MSAIEIRLMKIEDYDEVFQLWSSTPGMCLRNYDDSVDGIAKFLKKNPTSNFVALSENCIIGVILSSNDGRRGYIYHATVHPDYRSRGIGKVLLRKVCDEFKKERISKAGLLVLKDNEIGNIFWKSQNWEDRTELNYYSKDI
jgi:N-acetylglutamate synthase